MATAGPRRMMKKEEKIGKTRTAAGTLYVKSIEAINIVSKKAKVHVEIWVGPKNRSDKLAYYATKDVATDSHAQWLQSRGKFEIDGQKTLKIRAWKGMKFLGKVNIDINRLPLDRSDQLIVRDFESSKKKKWAKLEVVGQLKLTVAFDAGPCQILKSMARRRAGHTMTLMPDGEVFICGGVDEKDSDPTNSVEIFDPTEYEFKKAMKFMTGNRAYHTATLLNSGELMLCGGYSEYGADRLGYVTSELYSPKTGYFEKIENMKNGRYRHAACLLSDGNVFIVGGLQGDTAMASCEIYDVKKKEWHEVEELPQAIFSPSLTLLRNGDVLLVGGCAGKSLVDSQESTFIYYPKLDTWGPGPILPERAVGHTVVAYGPNKIPIVTGGSDWYTSFTANQNAKYFSSVSIINTDSKKLTTFGRTRNACGLVFAVDNFLVSLGGQTVRKGVNVECCMTDADVHMHDSEKYDQQWTRIGDLMVKRYEPAGVLLKNGKQVLIAGGIDGDDRQNCVRYAELYDVAGTIPYKKRHGLTVGFPEEEEDLKKTAKNGKKDKKAKKGKKK